MDHRCRRGWFAGAALGWPRCFSQKGLPVRVSAALSRGTLDRPHGIALGPAGEIYVTPVSKDQVCVALISRDSKLRLTEALHSFPELRERLEGAETSSVEKGALTATCKLKRVSRGNVALIGDASGTVDAITGEGLCLAFSQAMVLADCLRAGDLARYEHEHRRLALRPLLMSRLMLTLDGRPRLQRRTLQAFRKRPDVFRRLLELHVGATVSPAPRVGWTDSGMGAVNRLTE